MRVRKVDDQPLDAKSQCGTCLSYSALPGSSKLGECKNSESGFYCDLGGTKGAVQITPDADACRYYNTDLNARTFLGKDRRTPRWWHDGLIAPVRIGLYQLISMVAVTGVFFYAVFRSKPQTYNYSRTEQDKLLY